jgi:hypothetical protein
LLISRLSSYVTSLDFPFKTSLVSMISLAASRFRDDPIPRSSLLNPLSGRDFISFRSIGRVHAGRPAHCLLLPGPRIGYDDSNGNMVNLAFGPFTAGLARSQEEEPSMKSKNPSKQHGPRGAAGSGNRSDASGRAITIDFVQYRIESFNREQGGGVIVRKDRNGYTLARDDTGVPIARLRPKDTQGRYEVLCWNAQSDRFRAVGTLGGTVLTLDEALDFIATDPMDCFWT